MDSTETKVVETPTLDARKEAAISEYRRFLVAGAQGSQEALDKALLTLSGGALGISVVFIKDILGPQLVVRLGALTTAWSSWSLSILLVVASFDMASRANRTAIAKCDDGTIYEHSKAPGGVFSYLTRACNFGAAALFVVGVIAMLVFVSANLKERNKHYDQLRQRSPVLTAASDTASKTFVTAPTASAERRRSEGDSRQGLRPATTASKKEVDQRNPAR